MAQVKIPSRKELEKFLPTHESIRAFEQLFKLTSELSESDVVTILRLIEELNIAGDIDSNKYHTASQDFIEFDINAPYFKKHGSLGWNKPENTLDISHGNEVIQQVGHDNYITIYNNSGSTLSKGYIIGYDSTSGDNIAGGYFIADNSYPSLYTLSVSAEDILDGDIGKTKAFGKIKNIDTTGTIEGEIWADGTILYASPTIAGRYTKDKPTSPNLVVPIAVVIKAHATEGILFVRPTLELPYHFGSFYDTTDQTAALANTAYPITFNATESSNGVSIGTPTSRIVIDNSGLYEINFSVQITSNSLGAKELWFFPRVNGVNIVNSAMRLSVRSFNGTQILSRAMTFSFNAGDYIEAMWATDDVNVTLESAPATAFAPATPSVIMNVYQIAQ